MNDQPRLSDAEWALIGQLLEQEEQELPAEIHHTRTATVKEDLHQRLRMVQDLRKRLSALAAV
jgi:hypothetical protein